MSTTRFAKEIGITYQTLYRKMHGKSPFMDWEIEKSMDLLHLTPDEVCAIFFDTNDYVYVTENQKEAGDGSPN
nr:MAG TPA: Cro/C1-type HTH DNA-binding domain protein [Caudoviricetes sp.]